MLSFGILGPLRVASAGRELPIGRGKQATVLAVLLANRGSMVSPDALIEALWPREAPPPSAVNAVQGYISRLRKAIEPDPGHPSVIVNRGRGYVLDVADEALDVAKAEQLLADARHRSDRAEAASLLREALALWRGDPFADFRYEDFAREAITRLQELRTSIMEERAEAELDAGAGAELVSELQAAAVAHPTRERLIGALMLSLYRAGRHADALEVYTRARVEMDEDGIEPGPALADLQAAILRHDPGLLPATPPTPAPPSRVDGNVPRPHTSFIERGSEIAEVSGLVAENRLVTLTGPGGIGKTRLASEIARAKTGEFPDGAWFLGAADATDARSLAELAAAVFGVAEQVGESLTTSVGNTIGDRRMLLILDNCEHLVEHAAELASTLLARAPRAHILATSREPLRLAGEQVWRVPPLATPEAGGGSDVSTYSAARLFLDRVRRARPDYGIDEETASAVATVCRRLDGIPLAIELAAGLAAVLTPLQIAESLEDRFNTLHLGARGAPERHQTLRAAIDWGYELLPEDQRRLFRRASVFIGGFTLEAFEAVCGSDGTDPLQALIELVRASLIESYQDGARARFYLLEPIRQRAAELLADEGDEAEDVAGRHMRFFAELAMEPAGHGDHAAKLSRLEREHGNLRAALQRCLTAAPERAPGMAGSLAALWQIHGYLTEGREWLRKAVAAADGAGDSEGRGLARALSAAGTLAVTQGDFADAQAQFERALATWADQRDDAGVAEMQCKLGIVALYRGEQAEARALLEDSLTLRRQIGDARGIADSLNNLGVLAQEDGDLHRARTLYEESLAITRELGEHRMVATAVNNLGEVARLEGDLERAADLYLESLALDTSLENKWGLADARRNLALISMGRGDLPAARTHVIDALELCSELGDPSGVIKCVEIVAALMAEHGRYQDAADLYAIAGHARDGAGIPLQPSERADQDVRLAEIRANGASASGRRFSSLDEAAADALQLLADAGWSD